MSSLHSDTPQVMHYSRETGFPDNGILALHEDADGSMLVGTAWSGLVVLGEDSVRVLTVEEGLASNTVHSITRDVSGRLWVGTSVGMVHEVRPHSKRFVTGEQLRGAAVYECGTTKDGVLWFMTPTDLHVLDPMLTDLPVCAAPAYISGVQVNGEMRARDAITTLQADENNCTFSFVGISYTDPASVQYEYRLRGAETTWSGPTGSTSVSYRHLDPGDYVFEVRTLDIGGSIRGLPATVAFSIEPGLTGRWWFRTAVFLAGMLIVWVAAATRIRFLRARERATEEYSYRLIEQQEQERHRISQELHDGLGQEFIVISNRARRGMKHSSDAQAQHHFELIAQSASHALMSVREIAMDLSPYHLEHFGLAATLRNTVLRMTDGSDLDVVIDIHEHELDNVVAPAARIHVYRIVQEAISNVLKHARASKLQVVMAPGDATISITIADNGTGMSPRATQRGGSRLGMGMIGFQERAALIGGRVFITSVPGQGCTVVLTLPVSFAQGSNSSPSSGDPS